MRYLFGFLCVCALGVMPLVGCSETSGDGGNGGTAGDGGSGGEGGSGGVGACADWAGDWTLTSVSCDGVASDITGVELSVAADCTGETVIMISATCEEIIQMTFTPGAGDTTIVDNGAITCSGECASHECEVIADAAQPYAATVTVSGDTLTLTALTTQQMVSDEFTPCEVGQTMVSVAVVATGVTDACTNDTDLALVCDAGFSDTLDACDEAGGVVGADTATCLEADPGLSTDCASCFGADIDCLVANCMTNGACFPDNRTIACEACRADNCYPALDACTGDYVCE